MHFKHTRIIFNMYVIFLHWDELHWLVTISHTDEQLNYKLFSLITIAIPEVGNFFVS